METSTARPQYTLPTPIAAFAGQINDIDSHECTPIQSWVDEFGQELEQLRDACVRITNAQAGRPENDEMPPPIRDEAPIDAKNVWNLKMEYAPGAFDFQRRLK